MRDIRCYHFRKDGEKMIPNSNSSCWAGIKSYLIDGTKLMYISKFRKPATEKYIPLLLRVINKITPVKLVTINNVEYIEFKLLKTYDQNVVLLNFIRNLWDEPVAEYTKTFFETLENSKFKDMLAKLCNANIHASKHYTSKYRPGHSNCLSYGQNGFLKVTQDLLEYKGNNTNEFLTTPSKYYHRKAVKKIL
jgi:hypothetical protein